jgi:hypothetical protein
MSRGYGRVQRAIIDWLATEPGGRNKRGVPVRSTIVQAAAHVYGTSEPTEAQLVAVRRAVRGLAAAGAIENERGWGRPRNGARRLKLTTRVVECDGDGCEWCETGIPRYEGTWIANEMSKKHPYWTGRRDPDWEGPLHLTEKYADREWAWKAWHLGEMAPRRKMDAVSVRLLRRVLTDDERDNEQAMFARTVAAYKAAAGEAAKPSD